MGAAHAPGGVGGGHAIHRQRADAGAAPHHDALPMVPLGPQRRHVRAHPDRTETTRSGPVGVQGQIVFLQSGVTCVQDSGRRRAPRGMARQRGAVAGHPVQGDAPPRDDQGHVCECEARGLRTAAGDAVSYRSACRSSDCSLACNSSRSLPGGSSADSSGISGRVRGCRRCSPSESDAAAADSTSRSCFCSA